MITVKMHNYKVSELQELHTILLTVSQSVSASHSPALFKDVTTVCEFIESEYGFLLDCDDPNLLGQKFYKPRPRRNK